jgi:hypothetical protein
VRRLRSRVRTTASMSVTSAMNCESRKDVCGFRSRTVS